RPHRVPAQLPDAAAAGHCRRRAREGLLPVEHDGQLRVDQWIRRSLRARARGLQDAEAHAEAECCVVPRSGEAQRGRVIATQAMSLGRRTTGTQQFECQTVRARPPADQRPPRKSVSESRNRRTVALPWMLRSPKTPTATVRFPTRTMRWM